MLKILVVFCFIIAPQAVCAQGTISDLDKKNGFRDVKFGDSLSTFKNLKSVEYPPHGREPHTWSHYERTTDLKKIGDVPLDYISYLFYKGRLLQVGMQTEGNFRELMETVVATYGSYTRIEKLKEVKNTSWYVWDGKTVIIRITKGPKWTGLIFESKVAKQQIDDEDLKNKMLIRIKDL